MYTKVDVDLRKFEDLYIDVNKLLLFSMDFLMLLSCPHIIVTFIPSIILSFFQLLSYRI